MNHGLEVASILIINKRLGLWKIEKIAKPQRRGLVVTYF